MRPWIKCLIFAVIVILSIFVCLANLWILVAGIIVTLIVLIILATRFVQVRSFLGYLGFKVGNDNNYRLAALGTFILICFICAIKYGAGEPLFLSAWRETSEIVQSSETYNKNKDDVQSFKNRLVRGLDKTDRVLNREKAYIKSVKNQLGQVLIPKEKNGNETPEVYNQKIRNHLTYGVFVDDSLMNGWLKNIPAEFQVALEIEKPRRTWIFWKLLFMFIFLFLLYLPFALSDEVVDLLEKLRESISKKHEEYKASVVRLTSLTPAPAGLAVNGISQKFGWFVKLYTSDMAAEFTIKLLEGLTKLLSRR
ncbi:MAG: hypothetical protein Q8P63_00855 [Candidatus Nealsonbacteria bacterium]|nr:hypothetical protein [Candidatus Nealsonbacteria bacterium]